MRKHRGLTAVLSVVAISLPLFAVPSSPATAAVAMGATGWPIDVTHQTSINGLIPGEAGAVTAYNCGQRDTLGQQTWAASGGSLGILPTVPDHTQNYACTDVMAVRKDGMQYSVVYKDYSSPQKIVASKQGALIWGPKDLGCTNSSGAINSLAMSSDGSLYAVASCNGQSKLHKLNGTTGAANATAYTLDWHFGSNNVNVLTAFAGGVVISTPSSVRYHSGSLLETKRHAMAFDEPYRFDAVPSGTTVGRVFMPVGASVTPTPTCRFNRVTTKVVGFSPTATVWTYTMPACRQLKLLRPTPSGGVAMLTEDHAAKLHLTVLRADKVQAWTRALTFLNGTGDNATGQFYFTVDTAGNVVLSRNFVETANPNFRGRQFDLLAAAGGAILRTVRSTPRSQGESSSVETTATTTVPGRVYFSVSRCCGQIPFGKTIEALTLTGAGGEFPRATLLGYSTTAVPAPGVINPVRVRFMGDSFTGEGGGDYEPGTDVNDEELPESQHNMCHRSANSYAHLLNQRADLEMTGYVGCSGATTRELVFGQYTEIGQNSTITSADDILVLSIGGNDVGFKEFATACVDPFLESCDQVAKNLILGKINSELPSKLANTYDTTAGWTRPETVLNVMGYPHLIPHPDWDVKTHPWCSYLSDAEMLAVREVTDTLNTKIREAVNAAKLRHPGKFEFIDPTQPGSPFDGHQLCSGGAYFNGMNADPSLWTTDPEQLHPNRDGYKAYEFLIADNFRRRGLIR